MLPDLNIAQWIWCCLAALGIGVSKSGLPGVSLMHVLIFAHLFQPRESTGVVLPMLIAGDVGAVLLFRRHAQWKHVFRTLPPALIGVILGWLLMSRVPSAPFKPIIGGIVFGLAALQLLRHWKPEWQNQLPHTATFAISMGLIAGVTTMLANAAGPVMGLYLIAVSLPKDAFVGTSAWFFLLINLFKVPFSLDLGLINTHTLALNLLLTPIIIAGLYSGRFIMHRIPQKWFDTLVLVFAIIAALKLLF